MSQSKRVKIIKENSQLSFYIRNFQANFCDWWLRYIQRNYLQINVLLMISQSWSQRKDNGKGSHALLRIVDITNNDNAQKNKNKTNKETKNLPTEDETRNKFHVIYSAWLLVEGKRRWVEVCMKPLTNHCNVFCDINMCWIDPTHAHMMK